MEDQKIKTWTPDEARESLKRWCAKQERCHLEVKLKMAEHKIYGDLQNEILTELISENFINEERFARAYARGKFRMNDWGKNKILFELRIRKISAYCIKKALEEIDQDEYLEKLQELAIQKIKLIKTQNPFDKKQKVKSFLMQKGYETDLISDLIDKLV